MLNEDFFETPEQLRIARQQALIDRLERTIAAFKEYDTKRSEEYHRLVAENKWYKEEMEISYGKKKADKLQRQRDTIHRLERTIQLNEYRADVSLEDIDKMKVMKERDALSAELTQVKNTLAERERTIDELIFRINEKKAGD